MQGFPLFFCPLVSSLVPLLNFRQLSIRCQNQLEDCIFMFLLISIGKSAAPVCQRPAVSCPRYSGRTHPGLKQPYHDSLLSSTVANSIVLDTGEHFTRIRPPSGLLLAAASSAKSCPVWSVSQIGSATWA